MWIRIRFTNLCDDFQEKKKFLLRVLVHCNCVWHLMFTCTSIKRVLDLFLDTFTLPDSFFSTSSFVWMVSSLLVYKAIDVNVGYLCIDIIYLPISTSFVAAVAVSLFLPPPEAHPKQVLEAKKIKKKRKKRNCDSVFTHMWWCSYWTQIVPFCQWWSENDSCFYRLWLLQASLCKLKLPQWGQTTTRTHTPRAASVSIKYLRAQEQYRIYVAWRVCWRSLPMYAKQVVRMSRRWHGL